MIFWTKFAQKRYFQCKIEKVSSTIEFSIFELVQVLNFSLNQQLWFFGLNLPKMDISVQKEKKFPVEKRENKLQNWILHIQISVKYQISAKHDNFDFLDQLCPKRVIAVKNGKSEHYHWILLIRISLRIPNFSLNWEFWFFYQICPNRNFPVVNEKNAPVRVSIVITYYTKSLRTSSDRHNGIWMSLFLLNRRGNYKFSWLRIQWKLIFANVIRCSRLRLWVHYFIFFKFTHMFFYLMLLMDVP